VAREAELPIPLRRLTASSTLIEDLDGGWITSPLEETERLARHGPAPEKALTIPAAGTGLAAVKKKIR
jgi:hypothetical protein